jgi:hypothetical protein
VSLVDAYALDRIWAGEVRDVRLRLDDGSFQPPAVDPFWTGGWPPGDERRHEVASWVWGRHHPSLLRRRSNFICMNRDDVAQHALAPLYDVLPETVNTFFSSNGSGAMSAAHALLTAWLLPCTAAPQVRGQGYWNLLDVVTSDAPMPLR